MKSILFAKAIINRNKIRFLYDFNEVILEPYYISRNKRGKKVLFGKLGTSNEIRMFEYDRMCNIKILHFEKFSPVIPILN